ncbi:MAG: DUF58 domain-containing protein [Clostridiales bacterium]|jgi:hypothetical protein|nr:DUF58 domain-containing protein [Clostridiales bacterium]
MIKSRVFYGAILILCIILIFFEKGKSSFTLLYTLLLLPIGSFVMCLISKYCLKINRACNSEVNIKGEEADIRLIIYNKSLLPIPSLTFTFSATEINGEYSPIKNKPVSITMAPFEKYVREFSVIWKYRGVYEILPKVIYLRDFLGLFEMRVNLREVTKLIVYPLIVEIKFFPLAMNLLSGGQSRFDRRTEDYANMADTRRYEPSDSMKRIHWKLSAKRNLLMVKNFESSALNFAVVFLDLHRVSDEKMPPNPFDGGVLHGVGVMPENREYVIAVEDKMLELAVCVCNYCLNKQIPLNFCAGLEVIYANNHNEFDNLYTLAANAEFNHDTELSDVIGSFINEETIARNIIVITALLTKELYETLAGMHRFGHKITVLYVVPMDDRRSYIAGMLLDVGVKAFSIFPWDETEQIFENM